ncbi:MAG: hypothetical protein WBO10_06145 [Pyrinomonadaceae bacterium]
MSEYFISRERAENDLLDCAAYLAERIRSADGHAEAMNSVLPRYLAKGDVDLAAELANAVDDPYSRDRLLILVAEKCAEIDDDEYALQLADAVEDHGLRAQALERIAIAKAHKGQHEKASEVAESLAHPDQVLAAIAVDQAVKGDAAAAEETFGRIEFATARANGWQQIAAAQLESESPEKAATSLERALGDADEIEHQEERLRALCDIGAAFNDAGRRDLAIETFEIARSSADALDNVHRDFFLVNCALGFLYAGSEELCERTLDLVADKTQMASALLGVARYEWKNDEKENAADTLDEAYEIIRSQRDIETRDSRARNALMASIAVQFCAFGKPDRAVEIAQENQDIEEQYGALTQTAQLLSLRNEDELARQTVNEIPDDANRLFAFVAMSDAKKQINANDEAMQLLDEAAELSETVPQLASRSGVLNEIAERYIVNALTEKARAATLENLAVIAEIRDESSRAASLAGIADVYEASGMELTDGEKALLVHLAQKAE